MSKNNLPLVGFLGHHKTSVTHHSLDIKDIQKIFFTYDREGNLACMKKSYISPPSSAILVAKVCK